MKNDPDTAGERLNNAYHKMLERVRENLRETVQDAAPRVKKLIDSARDNAIELGELTREEAEKVGDYLRRDLHDAAEYMQTTRKELADWLRFDLELVEDRLLDMFSHVTDATRIELDKLAQNAEMAEWHTGEITSPGTLRCDGCDHDLHFHNVGHIPPCPACHGTMFHRVHE